MKIFQFLAKFISLPDTIFDKKKSTLIYVMAWCHQTSRYHLQQSWLNSITHSLDFNELTSWGFPAWREGKIHDIYDVEGEQKFFEQKRVNVIVQDVIKWGLGGDIIQLNW